MKTVEQALDPLNSGSWVLVEDTPNYRRYELDNGDHIVCRTEHKQTQELLDLAAEERSRNLNQRWGDGKVIGRMPDNLYWALGMGEARRQGDTNYIKKIWNDPDYKYLRTFEGKI